MQRRPCQEKRDRAEKRGPVARSSEPPARRHQVLLPLLFPAGMNVGDDLVKDERAQGTALDIE